MRHTDLRVYGRLHLPRVWNERGAGAAGAKRYANLSDNSADFANAPSGSMYPRPSSAAEVAYELGRRGLPGLSGPGPPGRALSKTVLGAGPLRRGRRSLRSRRNVAACGSCPCRCWARWRPQSSSSSQWRRRARPRCWPPRPPGASRPPPRRACRAVLPRHRGGTAARGRSPAVAVSARRRPQATRRSTVGRQGHSGSRPPEDGRARRHRFAHASGTGERRITTDGKPCIRATT